MAEVDVYGHRRYRFVSLLAPANQMSYDTQQFYNSALAIFAGVGPPPSRFACCRRCRRRSGPAGSWLSPYTSCGAWLRARFLRSSDDWRGRVYDRLSVFPDAAEPLQRAQLLAALSVGAEIIRLRRTAHRLGLGPDLDAALAALARGDVAGATAGLSGLDHAPMSLPGAEQKPRSLSGHTPASSRSPRSLANTAPISMQER